MFRRISKVTALLGTSVMVLATTPAAAKSVQFEGQVRIRTEADDRSFQEGVDFEIGTYQRTRFGVSAQNDDGARIFIQLQDSRKWGDEGSTLADTENLDLHQAFVHLEDPNVDGLEWRLGRQELQYGAGRVFSKLDWSNVGRSFDAAKLHMDFGPQWLDLGFAKVSQDGVAPADENVAFAYWHIDVEDTGFELEPLLVYKENSAANQYLTSFGDHARFQRDRIKVYQDFVYQTGDVAGHEAKAFLFDVLFAIDVSEDRDESAGLAAGYSLYTGDDPSDADDSAYDNLYYDSHKYHGYMDVAGGFADAAGVGLQDVFVKGWFQADSGIWVKAGIHVFTSDIDVTGLTGDRNDLGKEFDVVVGQDLRSGLSAQIGAGLFSPGNVIEQLVGDNSARWAYLQGTVSF